MYGLFYPHGLGHMLGLDVHDMEALGEDMVGYDPTILSKEYLHLMTEPNEQVNEELSTDELKSVSGGINLPQLQRVSPEELLSS